MARLALRTQELDFDRLIGPTGRTEAGTHAVVDLRITGTVRLGRRAPPPG